MVCIVYTYGVVVAIFKFGLSGLDLGGDINLSYLLIHGHTYMYFFNNETFELITSLNCTFRNETWSGLPLYDCVVQDEVAGYLSLAFTMTFGILSAYFVCQKLWKSSRTLYFVTFIILIPVQVVLFPVMIIVVKVSIYQS